MGLSNGSTPKGTVCPERSPRGAALHCWHTSNTPIANPGTGGVVFVSVCCFCAPTYMHIDVLVPSGVPDEAITAEQLRHGHLVTIKSQPKRGPAIMVPGR